MDYRTQIPKRFYSLDVLRGIASISVVLWHWQHFFYNGVTYNGYNIQSQPFYSILFLFYQKGALAVELFFTLSGFVFFWLYSKKIQEKKTSGKEFFLLRFSRLYPLHFFTLMLVLLLQFIFRLFTGTFFVFPFNDLYHFILNVFFISNWGLQDGFSFNGPIWSVSIEVLIYVLFFIFAYIGGSRSILICILIVLGSVLLNFFPKEIMQGVFSFFIGGITFLLYEKAIKFDIKRLTIIFAIITIIFWVLTIVSLKYDLSNYLNFDNKILYKIGTFITANFVAVLLFPITIITLAISETYRGQLGRRFQAIGDITYSTYLLHFPLQIIFVLLISFLGLGSDFFYTKLSFVIFFIVLIVLSLISFNYFEKPFQLYLREKFLHLKN